MWWAREVNSIYGACFASSAIRCCRVDMSPSSDALAMFPSNDSMMRHPLPSPGSLRVRFSWFLGTMRCSDALRPFRRAWLPSLGDTCPCACLRLSHTARRRPGAWSFRVWQLHASFSGRETTGPLRFLGNPGVRVPRSRTPVGPQRQALRRLRHGPRCGDDEGSHDQRNFGAQ